MASYNVHEAKTRLSRLLEEMAAGEPVIIMRNGEPVAKLVPFREPERKKRRLGFAAGSVSFPEGWEKPWSDEEADAFLEGRL